MKVLADRLTTIFILVSVVVLTIAITRPFEFGRDLRSREVEVSPPTLDELIRAVEEGKIAYYKRGDPTKWLLAGLDLSRSLDDNEYSALRAAMPLREIVIVFGDVDLGSINSERYLGIRYAFDNCVRAFPDYCSYAVFPKH